MKKYIKPSIEVIEAALTKDCMLGYSNNGGNENEYFAPSRKDVVDDTNDLNDGWN